MGDASSVMHGRQASPWRPSAPRNQAAEKLSLDSGVLTLSWQPASPCSSGRYGRVEGCSRPARSRRMQLVPSLAAVGGARPGCSNEVPGG
eukprot:scaffold96843_cov42-Phaeocystis_antarctica.AAC.2